MSKMKSFREAFGEILVETGSVIKNLVVIDTDVAKSTKTIYFANSFPERFIEIGISEQDAVGTAAGLALAGKIPVVAAFSMFIMRSWEQIRNTVSRDNINVKIVGTHAGLSDYLDGASHQCLEDIALMRVLPNMTIVSPSDITSTKALFQQILEFNGPAYFRLGRDNANDIYKDEDEVKLNKANILIDGDDLTLVSYGSLVSTCVKVSKILKARGYKSRVIDFHTLKPLDTNMILKAAMEASPIFVIEEHNVYGGLGSAITEFISQKNPTKIFIFGIPDRFGLGAYSYEELLDYFGLTPVKLVNRIEEIMNEV